MKIEQRQAKERYGIELSKIDEAELSAGEKDILNVFEADLHDPEVNPAPLIVGMMHYIQQKHVVGFEDSTREYESRGI